MAPPADFVATASGGGQLEPAWLLHRRPFRNTSLTLELLTPRGRLGAVARGGRKNSLLSPFVPLWVALRPSGELYSLTTLEPREGRPVLHGKALYCGFYLNELYTRLLHRDDPQPELWALYSDTLQSLALTEMPLDVLLRRFELQLLDALGYGIDLQHDSDGKPLQAECCYQLDPERGLRPAADGFAGAQLLALAAGQWHADSRRTAKLLCRQLLAPHLGDRPLKSRELFRGR